MKQLSFDWGEEEPELDEHVEMEATSAMSENVLPVMVRILIFLVRPIEEERDER